VHSNVWCFSPSPSNGVTNVRWFPLAICVHRIDFYSKLHTMLHYIPQSFDFFHPEQSFPSVLAKALLRIYHGSMLDLRSSSFGHATPLWPNIIYFYKVTIHSDKILPACTTK
jgi:hypothetical protein